MRVMSGKIRERRCQLGLSRAELAEKTGVTSSAIANYENGVSYPKPEIFVSLLQALGVDANYFFDEYTCNKDITKLFGKPMSQDEYLALDKYRRLTDSGKKMVRLVIEEEYNRMQRKQWISFPCYGGKSCETLTSSFAFMDHARTVKIRKDYLIEGMDFCFEIMINRYEPIFHKGDVIALSKKETKPNQIGIFSINGHYYLRVLFEENGVRKLRALNVVDKDVEIKEEDHFVGIGTVLGKVQKVEEGES